MALVRSWSRRAFVALLAALASTLDAPRSGAQPSSGPVTVFAAASLKNAMDDVVAAFTARTHIPARASYGASSALARQVEQGAPADVFVSADVDWMDYVAKRRLIVAGSRRDLLSNHLAVIAPADSKISLKVAPGMPLAAALGSGRLAIAGPDVPAGRYGQASLAALGVWPSLQDRLARAESVRAALAFVARGETPLGVVYDTDARVEPRVRIVGLFPDATHPPIIYPAAIVAASHNPGAATFMRFLSGREAAAIFHRYGFQTPAHR